MYQSKHLTEDQKVRLGSFYTPRHLVKHVLSLVEPFIDDNTVILDNAAGFGAFVADIMDKEYRAADNDLEAYKFLKSHFDKKRIFLKNSLLNVSRNELNIRANHKLIVVGNPPYNDTTSEFRNGRKGKNVCDLDLYDRDLGVSFLKSYNKLRADYICVLHPLSYLIKETNFLRLRGFKDSYRLIKGLIFSSAEFEDTGSAKFPILIGLYERSCLGMNYQYVKDFPFDVIGSDKKFFLSNYSTTDGLINKYPPRKTDNGKSDIDLYFYTFRDMNSLKRNRGFIGENNYNGVVVNLEDLHKYSYLNALKFFFEPDNSWLYGNLSPLLFEDIFEKLKNEYIIHALETNKVLLNKPTSFRNKIVDYYKLKSYKSNLRQIERILKDKFSKLII